MTALTKAAEAQLMRLKHLRDDASALANSTADRISQLRRTLLNSPPDADKIKLEIDRLSASMGAHQAQLNGLSALLTNIRNWHAALKPDVTLVDAKPVKPTLINGDNINDALARVRARIALLTTELKQTQRCQPTRDEQVKAIKSWVHEMAENIRPKLKANIHGKFVLEFEKPNDHAARMTAIAVQCWINPKVVTERLLADLDELPRGELVLNIDQKAEQIADIHRQIIAVEREEIELVEMGEAEGQRFDARPFTSPLAILKIEIKRNKSAARIAA